MNTATVDAIYNYYYDYDNDDNDDDYDVIKSYVNIKEYLLVHFYDGGKLYKFIFCINITLNFIPIREK